MGAHCTIFSAFCTFESFPIQFGGNFFNLYVESDQKIYSLERSFWPPKWWNKTTDSGVGEDVEKLKLSCIAAGSRNWYRPCGKLPMSTHDTFSPWYITQKCYTTGIDGNIYSRLSARALPWKQPNDDQWNELHSNENEWTTPTACESHHVEQKEPDTVAFMWCDSTPITFPIRQYSLSRTKDRSVPAFRDGGNWRVTGQGLWEAGTLYVFTWTISSCKTHKLHVKKFIKR